MYRQRHRPRTRLRQGIGADVILAVTGALGLLLILVSDTSRDAFLRWLGLAARSATGALGAVDQSATRLVRGITVGDIFGSLLLAFALAFLAARARTRLLQSATLASLACPKCGSRLHRIHRTALDHGLNFLVPVRRYRCAELTCRWEGLRLGRTGDRSRSPGSSRQGAG